MSDSFEKAEKVKWIAIKAGLQTFLVSGAISAACVVGLLRFSPAFRRNTGASGRVATGVLPALFASVYVSEQTLAWHANSDAFDNGFASSTSAIDYAIDVFANHPAPILASLGIPVVGGIFFGTRRLTHLSLSQKIMHTRVIGQFSVLAILCGLGLAHFVSDSKRDSKRSGR